MGKFFAFVCLGVFLFSTSALAGLLAGDWERERKKQEVNSRGEIRVVDDGGDVWRDTTAQEATAIARPGEEIPVDLQRTDSERDGFFYIIPVSQYTKVVVFVNNRIQVLEKTAEVRGERTFAVYVVLCLISMFFMFISNILLWERRTGEGTFDVAAIATVSAAIAIVAVSDVAVVAVSALFAIAVAAFALVASDMRKRPYVFVCSAIYYVAMVVALII